MPDSHKYIIIPESDIETLNHVCGNEKTGYGEIGIFLLLDGRYAIDSATKDNPVFAEILEKLQGYEEIDPVALYQYNFGE